ncbi:hypothetical protein HanPSC8_Chr06g0251801 [Helianthus annuus]|nr:hypothetical protein HanPSC8_Chr06g0251801 [Helianthus annuus]
MWAVTDMPSFILVLTNCRMRNTLFEADGFSYMLDKAFNTPYVVVSLTML